MQQPYKLCCKWWGEVWNLSLNFPYAWCLPQNSFIRINSTEVVNTINKNSSFCFYSYKSLFLYFHCMLVFVFVTTTQCSKLHDKVPASFKTSIVGYQNSFPLVTSPLKTTTWIKGFKYDTFNSRDTVAQLGYLRAAETFTKQVIRSKRRKLFLLWQAFLNGLCHSLSNFLWSSSCLIRPNPSAVSFP